MSLLWKDARGMGLEIVHAPGGTFNGQDQGRIIAFDTTAEPVGYVNYLHHTGSNRVGIDMLHVRPANRHRGIASKLMEHLADSFPGAEYYTADMSPEAQQWHDGYVARGGRPIHVDKPGSWW